MEEEIIIINKLKNLYMDKHDRKILAKCTRFMSELSTSLVLISIIVIVVGIVLIIKFLTD
jgi:hypothetical protein